MSTIAKGTRLTSFQRQILAELRGLSTSDHPNDNEDGWVKLGRIGAAATCRKLVDKGYAETRETHLYGRHPGKYVVVKWIRPLTPG